MISAVKQSERQCKHRKHNRHMDTILLKKTMSFCLQLQHKENTPMKPGKPVCDPIVKALECNVKEFGLEKGLKFGKGRNMTKYYF